MSESFPFFFLFFVEKRKPFQVFLNSLALCMIASQSFLWKAIKRIREIFSRCLFRSMCVVRILLLNFILYNKFSSLLCTRRNFVFLFNFPILDKEELSCKHLGIADTESFHFFLLFVFRNVLLPIFMLKRFSHIRTRLLNSPPRLLVKSTKSLDKFHWSLGRNVV